MSDLRSSGILLHPTSFPSHGGIGDLGPAAYEFIDFLATSRQGLWQILPLNPTGYGNSPYSSTSAFAGSPLLVSLERLAERGLIAWERVRALDVREGRVDYPGVKRQKMPLLREAATNFLATATGEARAAFDGFVQENAWWLEDFVLFDALRRRFDRRSWNTWPRELAHREPAALAAAREELRDELARLRFLQFAFFDQWRALHAYCRERGVKIVGDVAIFVSYDSSDVWTHPENFLLDEKTLEPLAVAGVPPDAFSATGQRWGNPLYRWDALRERGYDWWVRRMSWALTTCDIIRLDHFRGFVQHWEIPASEPTAVHGRWVDGPGNDLFRVLNERLGKLPFIAEDLGVITADVNALRERWQMPGMRILQFAFGNPGAHVYLPHRYTANSVVYTGTHDNDTTLGWWQSCAGYEREMAEALLGDCTDGANWAMIRLAAGSTANLCVVPLQDVLSLGAEARMNIPSLPNGNWAWRYAPGSLRAELAHKLAALAEVTDRLPGQ
ncbi:MAG: 4-alpha-glucanotransferase [Acidobacteriota bacterium]|nr:4-alpha-glucanotransferase [Acidobacteriota bacterium]